KPKRQAEREVAHERLDTGSAAFAQRSCRISRTVWLSRKVLPFEVTAAQSATLSSHSETPSPLPAASRALSQRRAYQPISSQAAAIPASSGRWAAHSPRMA